MMRIGTYLTLNADSEVTAVGAAYDVNQADLNVVDNDNYSIQPLRNGIHLIQYDPEPIYEGTATLIIAKCHVDEPSIGEYDGYTRYLFNNLWHHRKYHLPIEIFLRGSVDKPYKAYLCYLMQGFDPAALGATMADTTNRCRVPRGVSMPATFSFPLEVKLVGAWHNYNDGTDVSWEQRGEEESA